MKQKLFNRSFALSWFIISFLIYGLNYCKEVKRNTSVVFYGSSGVELEGKIITRKEYGPPNFGENPETDLKVKIYVLNLKKPVDVNVDPLNADPTNTDNFKDVKEMQMDIPWKMEKLVKKLIGKNAGNGSRARLVIHHGMEWSPRRLVFFIHRPHDINGGDAECLGDIERPRIRAYKQIQF